MCTHLFTIQKKKSVSLLYRFVSCLPLLSIFKLIEAICHLYKCSYIKICSVFFSTIPPCFPFLRHTHMYNWAWHLGSECEVCPPFPRVFFEGPQMWHRTPKATFRTGAPRPNMLSHISLRNLRRQQWPVIKCTSFSTYEHMSLRSREKRQHGLRNTALSGV